MAIYTKTGDKGKTSLFDGKRVFKDDIRVESYGTVDELNSAVGLSIAHINNRLVKQELIKIQHDLLEIGSALSVAAPLPVESILGRVEEFENLIDKLTKQMPELSSFILPGGGQGGSFLHVARAISRRSERQIVKLLKKEGVDIEVIRYMNRLSDLLFTFARYINFTDKIKDEIWVKK